MGSKEERNIMWSVASYRFWVYSENQRMRKRTRDGRAKGFGAIDKSVESSARRQRIRIEEDDLLRDQELGMRLLESRRKMQLRRALKNVFEERATPQDMDYITRQGEVLERFTIPEGIEDPKVLEELPEVIVTIVYVTPPNPKNSS